MENAGPSLRDYPRPYGLLNSSTGYRVSNTIWGHSNRNFGNVSGNNNSINILIDEESSRVQAWLSPLEPHKRHHDVRNRRLDGGGEWVLRRSELESWREGQDGSTNPILLCYGGPGVGKTYISSLVIDTLLEQTLGQNIQVLPLYCDYLARQDQSAVNMIGCLLRQVALGGLRIPDEIQRVFEESKRRGGQGPRLPDMLKLFVKTISSFERVYICVDAVDELLPHARSELLRALRQIIQGAPNVRLFLTGRPYILGELDEHLTTGAYKIHIVADQGDTARYLNWKIDDDDDLDPDLMTENLKNDIMKTMLEKASDTFLPVALNIDAILGETSLARRKKMLRKVATTGVDLDSVYDQTLRRIKEQKGDRSRLGMDVLMWVSHAERPLQIKELVLAVEMDSTDLDPENIRVQDTVLRACLGLVVVDKETSTARLTNHTLQRYLSQPGIMPNAHKTLAQTCLAYLNCEWVKGLPANNISNLSDMSFLEYSSFYWGSHAKMELSYSTKTLALELLNRYDNHISSTLLFNKIRGYHSSEVTRYLFTGLHCASYFGIDEVVAALIQMKGCAINRRDYNGFTPLMWAARWGNEGVVRLLLTHDDVSPDKTDNDGQTPLWGACWNGHEGVVRLLLTRDDVSPDKADNDGRTPLWGACSNGHEGVVRLLLSRGDANPAKPDNSGRIPLSRASSNGHEGVVRLLLARDDVDPDKTDNDGQTSLWGASWNGHEGVVRLLLAREDVNPDKPNSDGETPLWRASLNGHEGVVRLLLVRNDVDPDKPDDYGQTPLVIGSMYGHLEIVALLRPRTTAVPRVN